VKPHNLHVLGASGSGATTLGRALSLALGKVHLDTDDFYWLPAEQPYVESRPVEERVRLLQEAMSRASETGWVLSGALNRWGGAVVPLFDLVIFISTPTQLRITRLRERESSRFGAAIAPGGPRHAAHEEFIAWAAGYDDGTRVSRNRDTHEAWLLQLSCPVLRIDGSRPVQELVDQAMSSLGQIAPLAQR
jgi:adenylate kinase family enzyme